IESAQLAISSGPAIRSRASSPSTKARFSAVVTVAMGAWRRRGRGIPGQPVLPHADRRDRGCRHLLAVWLLLPRRLALDLPSRARNQGPLARGDRADVAGAGLIVFRVI